MQMNIFPLSKDRKISNANFLETLFMVLNLL